MLTFTLFSHSNSHHIATNYARQLSRCGRETHLSLVAVRGADVVEDVDVDVVEHHAARVCRRRAVVEDVAKDDAGLGRRDLDGQRGRSAGHRTDLDGRLDALESHGPDGVRARSLDELEVP